MKKLISLLLLTVCFPTYADWVPIIDANNTSFEKFIDLENVKQSGPMAIMRQVWELNNYLQKDASGIFSDKILVEYDCQNHQLRLLKRLKSTGHWAMNQELPSEIVTLTEGSWSPINPTSIEEKIINTVCPEGRDD